MWASPPTEVGSGSPVKRGGARRTRPTVFNRKTSVGRALCGPPRNNHVLYISKHQRQRRQRRDDPTFRAPCKIFQTCGTHQNNFPMCGARLGIQNLGFGGVLWFLSFAEERKEPAGGTKRIPPHKPHPRRTKRPAGVFFPSEIAVPVVRPAAQVVADVRHAQKRHHQKHARNHDDPPRVCQQRLLRE